MGSTMRKIKLIYFILPCLICLIWLFSIDFDSASSKSNEIIVFGSATNNSAPAAAATELRSGASHLVLRSAHWDRQLACVVLIGYFVSPGRALRVECGCRSGHLKVARQQVLNEGHGEVYNAIVFFCACGGSPPAEVLARIRGQKLARPIAVANSAHSASPRPELAACVPPLRHEPAMETQAALAFRIVEFVEVNRLLGVSHFFFYNLSLPRTVSAVLGHYESLGLASVFPWQLAKEAVNRIHYHGQVVAANDCLYRVRQLYQLAAFVDIDEFLVPLADADLLALARRHLSGWRCAVGFRHVAFPLAQEPALATLADSPELSRCRPATLTRSSRDAHVLPFTERSKVVALSAAVNEIGIHFVWNWQDKWRSCKTKVLNPDTEGHVHHSRQWTSAKKLVVKRQDRAFFP